MSSRFVSLCAFCTILAISGTHLVSAQSLTPDANVDSSTVLTPDTGSKSVIAIDTLAADCLNGADSALEQALLIDPEAAPSPISAEELRIGLAEEAPTIEQMLLYRCINGDTASPSSSYSAASLTTFSSYTSAISSTDSSPLSSFGSTSGSSSGNTMNNGVTVGTIIDDAKKNGCTVCLDVYAGKKPKAFGATSHLYVLIELTITCPGKAPVKQYQVAGFPEGSDLQHGIDNLNTANVVRLPDLHTCDPDLVRRRVEKAFEITQSWRDWYGNTVANIVRGIGSIVLNQPCTKAFVEVIVEMRRVK